MTKWCYKCQKETNRNENDKCLECLNRENLSFSKFWAFSHFNNEYLKENVKDWNNKRMF